MQSETLSYFPAVNATLNAASAMLLVIGRWQIAKHDPTGLNKDAHRRTMLAAFCTSTVFLLCYLYYHAHAGVLHFAGVGWRRPVYFTLLTSHTLLAVVIVPLILLTIYRGLKGQYSRHVRIAPLTFWLWLYVSVTGVVIYYLLYHLWRA